MSSGTCNSLGGPAPLGANAHDACGLVIGTGLPRHLLDPSPVVSGGAGSGEAV